MLKAIAALRYRSTEKIDHQTSLQHSNTPAEANRFPVQSFQMSA